MRQRVALQFKVTRLRNEATLTIVERLRSLMWLMDDYRIADAECIRIRVLHERSPRIVSTRCQDVTTDHRMLPADTHQSEQGWCKIDLAHEAGLLPSGHARSDQ